MTTHSYSTLVLLLLGAILTNGCYGDADQKQGSDLQYWPKMLRVRRQSPCPVATMCRSKWGYCGTDAAYCGDGCQAGPCTSTGGDVGSSGDIINQKNFQCVFNTLDDQTRSQRFDGLQGSGWKPQNNDEAAVFLAHVYHETDGLKTLVEYCAPGKFLWISSYR